MTPNEEESKDGFCQHHYELVSKVGNLKWLFIVMLGIVVAASGFLYRNTAQVRAELISYQDTLTGIIPGKEGILIQLRDVSKENNALIRRHLAKTGDPVDEDRQPSPRTGK